ncbi:hypothetical protein HPB52_016509 [Rhipicephalus sanguineus]|uniref:Uncharacterized protein n=1 Tax=Rhipicephalus sanguineus TaxID=34632 RepID=A0A9D4PXZ6_RHISA|nr:hypothetical protein HPB52_016509 [Rhipicephalus sanguineus]
MPFGSSSQGEESLRIFTLLRLIVPYIPDSNQLSWQKAAGMYQACLSFTSSYETETQYLVEWMRSLNLDFLNKTRLKKVNPVEMMVRGSVDLGVEAVIAIVFSKKYFKNNKRGMKLVEFTEPYMFLRDRSASDACYSHVRKVMNLAVLSPYFHSEIPPYIVPQAQRMVSEVRNAFLKALESSSWLGLKIREAAIRKLKNMTSYVGSPGRRSDPEFVESVYKPYPDAPLDILFPTWIKALSLSSHYIWTDQETRLYDEARRSPYYTDNYNDFTIPATSLIRPFMYYGITSLNYGGLGKLIGHEIMHGFDVNAIESLKDNDPEGMKNVRKEYTKRALCLRESHKSVLFINGQEEILNETLDSENLADFVGTKIGYDAFVSLVPENRDETLAGLDMSAEQLFFFNSCAIMCAQHGIPGQRYAPYRSRCMVPLINMPEFSRAFGCAAGTPMNPRKKCTFW